MKSNFDRRKIGKAPQNYIPGVFRGCHGFVTRSDIGPMMADVTLLAREHHMALQKEKERIKNGDDKGESGINDVNYDSWGGFTNARLFTGPEDEEDREADEIYATIDKYVSTRTKVNVEEAAKKEANDLHKRQPQANEQMKDVISDISKMTMDEWMNIPDVKTGRKRAKKDDKFTPVPDSLISDRLKQSALGSALDSSNTRTEAASGVETVIPGGLPALADARRKVLDMSIATVGRESKIDKTGYMTQLGSSLKALGNLDVHDKQKARLLFKKLLESDPHNPNNWVGAARIEELDNKIQDAKNILAKGIQELPDREEIWAEAIRMEAHDVKKALVAKAVKACPKSIKLWLVGADLEKDPKRKTDILEKALQFVPQSEKLWKALIEQSTQDSQAKEWLQAAVECVPDCLEFRLALARLCPYEEAKEVINKANKYFHSQERAIWVHASKLEEANGNSDKCELLIEKGISKVAKKKRVFDREEWVDEAQDCEAAGCPVTCEAIIKFVYRKDGEEKNPSGIWLDDVNLAIQRGRKETAEIMLETAVGISPQDSKLWETYLTFQQRSGDMNKYRLLLARAAKSSGNTSEQFILRLAKDLVKQGKPEEALATLKEASSSDPTNSAISLSYLELLKRLSKFDQCLAEIEAYKQSQPQNVEIWRYQIQLEKEASHFDRALEAAQKALTKFPQSAEIGCDLARVYEELSRFDKAREVYLSLSKQAQPARSPRLWKSWIELEERIHGPQKARPIFEQANKLLKKKNAEVWLKGVEIEEKANNLVVAKRLLAEAVKECPNSGELWVKLIESEPKLLRARKAYSVLETLRDDPLLVNCIARIFWMDLKREKAREWFERSLIVNNRLGDTWAWYNLFLQEGQEDESELVRRCIDAEPSEGRVWTSITNRPSSSNLSTEEILLQVKDEVLKLWHKLKK